MQDNNQFHCQGEAIVSSTCPDCGAPWTACQGCWQVMDVTCNCSAASEQNNVPWQAR